MGLAVDTVVGTATNPGAAFTPVTVAQGDTLTVRNFSPTDSARLLQVIRQGAASGQVRVRSPLLHDDVQGIRFFASETPTKRLLPRKAVQPVQSGDTLTVEVTGGAAEVDLAALQIFYNNLKGASARLHNWGDIAGNIENLYSVLTTCVTSATAGAWADTAINATEDVFKSNRDYAILGYQVDAACAVVAYRGDATGNLRVGGPGATDSLETAEFFVGMNEEAGVPFIPVFNSASRGAFNVSVSAVATAATVNVTTIMALLSQNLAD